MRAQFAHSEIGTFYSQSSELLIRGNLLLVEIARPSVTRAARNINDTRSKTVYSARHAYNYDAASSLPSHSRAGSTTMSN